jgi:hypothetical protein
MIKYAFDTERTCGEILDDLEAIWTEIADFKFFIWPDEKTKEVVNVVAWVEGEDKFPDDWDEEAEKTRFFADINREIRLGI